MDEAVGLRVLSTRFMGWRDAWLRLCADFGIDWEAYLSLHPAGGTMRFLENFASDLALIGEDDEAVATGVDERYAMPKEMLEQRMAART